ncbi:F-box/kelch-repeat protein At3g23880-like [Cicer arietinum]|uniref:F-box/kelch-repeat protein At3g23880-like n=1 Tax=Cicer arietinum TaxID=3827 RepID=A0A1S2XD40_CICAR|nr:F-box/kelch-repeat protein At3g23880-like [Cicer arietinum]
MEETTATKRPSLNSSTQTLITLGDSLPTLPFELIIEILSRLPVKFLIQLQCVCKSWKSLISDPKFAKMHLRMSTTRHLVVLTLTKPSRSLIVKTYPLSSLFTEITATATQLAYPLNNDNQFEFIVGSCHGILCFAIDQSVALLWNPSIRKFTKLPSLEYPCRLGCYTIYAFGYDHFSDTYKVVSVSCYRSFNLTDCFFKTKVKIHTLGTNSWRRIQDFPTGVPFEFDESGKFVNGTINWLASTNSSSLWVIVSLNLKDECYQELLLPDYGGVDVVTLTIGVLSDCLCILSYSDTFSDVWLMKEYGNKDSWTNSFRVPFMEGVGSPYTKALYVSEDDQVLLECDSKLVTYNSSHGTFKTPRIQNIKGWMVPEIYQESLISPCFQQ